MHFAEEDHRLQGIKYIPREMQGKPSWCRSSWGWDLSLALLGFALWMDSQILDEPAAPSHSLPLHMRWERQRDAGSLSISHALIGNIFPPWPGFSRREEKGAMLSGERSG